MKRILSVMLTVVMLTGLFAVNASAMISKTYPDVMLSQDFSDASQLDFSGGVYGTATIADGCLTINEPGYDGKLMHVSSPAVIDETNWTVEFDVRRNSDFAETSYYGVTFTCDKAAYEGDAEKIANNIENYGVYVPLMHNEKGAWYTYRFTFDESKVVEQVPNVTSNIRNTLSKYLITKAEYKKAGDTEWTSLSTNGGWDSTGTKVRPLVYTQGKGYNYTGYKVEVDGEEVATENETCFVFHSPHSSYCATAEEEAAANFSLDNIKAYAATELDYPVAAGNILLTSEKPLVPDASGYVGENIYVSNNFTTNLEAPILDADNNTVSASNLTVTFDAKNTVQGLPIMIHIGGTGRCNGLTICPTDTIGTDWYSYKIVCSEAYTLSYTTDESTGKTEPVYNGNMSINEVFRKPMGSNADYERMAVAGKYDYEAGDEFWAYGTPSGGTNTIRIFYYPKTVSAAVAGTDPTKTVWEIKNLQVTDDAVVAGFANVANGQISVNADTVVSANNAMYTLAVYDESGRLVDIALENRASGIGEINLSANYTDGNDAYLMIWNVTASGLTSPRIVPVDVAAAAE